MSCRNLRGGFGGICGLSGKCVQIHRQERSESWAAAAGVKLMEQRAPTPIPCPWVCPCPTAQELMPSESSLGTGGSYPAAPPQHSVSCPGTTGTTTWAARMQTHAPVGRNKVTTRFQVTKTKLKHSFGRPRHPRRPWSWWVLSRTLGVRNTRVLLGWTSSFPAAEQLENMFGHVCWRLPSAAGGFPVTHPPPRRWPGQGAVLGCVVAAQPLGCSGTGRVGWGGEEKGGWET